MNWDNAGITWLPFWSKSCAGKIRFSKIGGEKALARLVKKRPRAGFNTVLYECFYCGGYHIGNHRTAPSTLTDGDE